MTISPPPNPQAQCLQCQLVCKKELNRTLKVSETSSQGAMGITIEMRGFQIPTVRGKG